MELKFQYIEKFFSYLLEYSFLLLPLFFVFSKNKKEAIPIILFFYGLVFFLQLHYFYDLPKTFRKFQIILYTFLEFAFFSTLLWSITKNITYRRLIVISSISFFIFQIAYSFFSNFQRIDSVSIGIETILIFIFSILFFVELFKIEKNEPLPISFYIVVGILFYLGPNFFFNLLVNSVTKEQFSKYWHFTYIPEIIKNIIFAVSILFINSKNKIKNQEIAMPPGFLD